MVTLSILAFSANDNNEEQKRVGLFIDSLLAQDNDNWHLYFLDHSSKDHFTLPYDPHITYLLEQVNKNQWFPAHYRNWLATKCNSPIIAHFNADCIYAPNFISTAINECKENKLVLCQRKNSTKDEFKKINTLQDVYELNNKKHDLHGQGCCGDCQIISRDLFLSFGGYYGLIKNGEARPDSWDIHAYREDTWLWYYAKNEDWYKYKFSKKPKILNEHWITDKTWIMHLYHDERSNIKKWK